MACPLIIKRDFTLGDPFNVKYQMMEGFSPLVLSPNGWVGGDRNTMQPLDEQNTKSQRQGVVWPQQ